MFLWYLLIYGAGRFVIEQLRQDSLYIGSLRASQYLSLVLCASAACLLLWRAIRQKRRLAVSLAICAAWLMRWMVLDQLWLYVGLLLGSGVAALWLKRERRSAIVWLSIFFGLDGLGVLLAALQTPFSACAGPFVHALLCSASLPMGIYALCKSDS